jgi:predicted GH43/DUF377 family glycosyl hydrolase
MKYFSIVYFLVLLFVLSLSSFAQINWIKQPNPVLAPGDSGAWDDLNVGIASVISLNDTLHMWYDANYGDENTGSATSGPNGIGHAISIDGISWTKDSLNPVLTPGPSSWESCWVAQASVLYNTSDSLFHMWYAGRGDCNTYQPAYIGHATSPEGSNWTKDSNWALGPGTYPSWDDDALVGPEVILVNDTLHMWYNGFKYGGTGNSVKIGHAVSTNWITWQKDPANPVLKPGAVQDWDYPRIRNPRVIYFDSTFHMFYNAGYNANYDIGYAQSNDSSNWTKYNDSTTIANPYMNSDPVLKKGPAGSWDDDFVRTGSVLFNDNSDSLRMWFTGVTNNVSYSQIGYASAFFDSSLDITGLKDIFFGEFPQEYELKQNYPNPFNPTTTIEFSIPKSEFVTLKIYNVIGEEVATLVSEKLIPGNYKYIWNASYFASGVYLYKIESGNGFIQSKKLLLIK